MRRRAAQARADAGNTLAPRGREIFSSVVGDYDADEAPQSVPPPREKSIENDICHGSQGVAGPRRREPEAVGTSFSLFSLFLHFPPYCKRTRWQTSQLPPRPTLPLNRRQRNSEPHPPVAHPHLHPLLPTQLQPPCPTPVSKRARPRPRSSPSPRSVSRPLLPRYARGESLSLSRKPHASFTVISFPASRARPGRLAWSCWTHTDPSSTSHNSTSCLNSSGIRSRPAT